MTCTVAINSEPQTGSGTDDNPARGSAGGVAAVNRALQVLAAIENARGPVSLTEISQATGLYKSTALRLIESLQNAAYVARLEDGHYVLGAAVLRMGIAYERDSPIRQQLRPVLQRLVEEGTESSSFHIRHGKRERLCMMRINSNHSTLDRVREGEVLPLDRGAAGKIILAYSGEIGRVPFSKGDLVALSLGERDKACAGMAGPVFSAGGHFLGALSLSGPRERFKAEDIERMRPLLLRACADLSATFGGSLP
jgi:DNA-binding IclR family transcriptional regulator